MVNTQRDAFWSKIYDLSKTNRDMVVISADMGAPALDKFRKDYPAQFVNVGIAEQNGAAIASGLALTGKKVFLYAIAPFVTLRCFEQIRVNSGIMNIPITYVGVGAGFGYEDSGPTHHIIEDIAVMRSIPHMAVNSITDSVMACAVAQMSCGMKGSNYVRLDRLALPDIYPEGTDFSKGMAVLKEGDVYIISTGAMTHVALEVIRELGKKGHKLGVIDAYSFPLPSEALAAVLKNSRKAITLEEHFLAGGLGSAVVEVMADHNVLLATLRIGITHEKGYCYQYGGREVIREYYGIDKASVLRRVEAFLAQK